MQNKIGKNRQSPKNEKDYINAYLKANPKANRQDGMDIAAVIAKDGTRGHGLLPEDYYWGHDIDYHRNNNFLPVDVIKKNF